MWTALEHDGTKQCSDEDCLNSFHWYGSDVSAGSVLFSTAEFNGQISGQVGRTHVLLYRNSDGYNAATIAPNADGSAVCMCETLPGK